MGRTLNTTTLVGANIYPAGTAEDDVVDADTVTAAVWDGEADPKPTRSTAKVPTISEIEKEVGDDPLKAQAALDAENARDESDRRSSLLEKLQGVIDASQQGEGD